MKLILLGFLCSAWFAYANSQANLNMAYEELTGITKQITIGVLEMLGSQLEDLHRGDAVTRNPVIPSLPDPLPLNDTDVTFTNSLLNGVFMSRESVITGLSTLTDDLTVVLVPLPTISATYRLDVSNVDIGGFYETDLDILSGTTHFVGNGSYNIQLTQGFVDVIVKLRVYALLTKIEITSLDIDLGFESLNIELQNASFNGVVANWPEINEELKRIFDIYWPVLNAKIVPTVTNIINHLIKTCTIAQLAAGNFECLNDEPLPEVTSAPEPTTSPASDATGSSGITEEITTVSGQTGPDGTTTEITSTPSSASVPLTSAILLSIAGLAFL